MKRLVTPLLLAVAAFLGFTIAYVPVALAASAASPSDGSLLDMLRPVIDAVTSGHYAAASAALLILAIALTRRYLAPHWAFLGTDAGGALLTLVGSLGAGLATVVAGGPLTVSGAWTAVTIAVGAAGGYTILNKLLSPLEAKAPAWMQPIFRLVTWIFDEVAPGNPGAVAASAAAGDAAVAAKPAQGAASSVGEVTELK